MVRSNAAVATAMDATISATHAAKDSATGLRTAVGNRIACAREECNNWAEHGVVISKKLSTANTEAETVSSKLSAGIEAMTTGFDVAHADLEEQQSASQATRDLAKETEQKSEAAANHLIQMEVDVSTQLEAANAKLDGADVSTSSTAKKDSPTEQVTEPATGPATEPTIQREQSVSRTKAAVSASENPFVPAKTKAKTEAGKGRLAGTDSDVRGKRRFGQKIENIR